MTEGTTGLPAAVKRATIGIGIGGSTSHICVHRR